MRKEWTTEEINILIENYPTGGISKCLSLINRGRSSIRNMIARLNIQHKNGQKLRDFHSKKRTEIKDERLKNDKIFCFDSPESAYILGILRADGYIKPRQVIIESIASDINELIPIFQKHCEWRVYNRDRENRKPQASLSRCDSLFSKFLKEYDYVNFNKNNYDKILNLVQESLHPYWFRGLFDGDGCFYINEKNKTYQMSICSNYEQDWSSLVTLFNKLQISFSIKRRTQTNKSGTISSHSVIRVTNKRDIIKFGNYIYGDYEINRIGLSRKYIKFKKILEIQKKPNKRYANQQNGDEVSEV